MLVTNFIESLLYKIDKRSKMSVIAPAPPLPRDPKSRSKTNKQGYEEEAFVDVEPKLRTKFILTSTNLEKIEKVGDKLFKFAVDSGLNLSKGVSRLPTRVLKITTRKSPCGEGSKTFDTYEMRIHKRCILLQMKRSSIKEFVLNHPEKDVDIEVTCQECTTATTN